MMLLNHNENLRLLTILAISIVRLQGHFEFIPQAASPLALRETTSGRGATAPRTAQSYKLC